MAISNDLYKGMVKRYESEIADAAVKLKLYIEGPQVIPEHPDITAEIDKLVSKIAESDDKLATLRQYCGKH